MLNRLLGIGTRHYGRSHVQSHRGTCPHCQASLDLTTFETRQYLTIFFLPIFSLGRRWVLDYCSACHAGTILTPDEWAGRQREELERGAEALKGRPDDPATASDLHRTLVRYGRRTQAAELLGLMEQRFPQDPAVQDYIRTQKSAATDTAERERRQRELRRKRSTALALIFVGLVVAFFFIDGYLARHRLVHVVNGWAEPLQVLRPGQSPLAVPPGKHVPWETSEGSHRVRIEGALTQEISFVIPAGFKDRWMGGDEYILNPGGAALLVLEETTYTAKTDGDRPLAPYRLYFGESFFRVPQVDYLFAPFPGEIQLRRERAAERKRRLDLIKTSPVDVFYSLLSDGRTSNAMALAEWHLQLHPAAEDLLPTYVGIALAEEQRERARRFIAAGVRRRPVDIQWHRMYQELEQGTGDTTALIDQYEKFLQTEPTNSALLYLRGRLAGSTDEAGRYYRQALDADPNNAFAHFALGYGYASRAEWTNALPHLRQAALLRPTDPQMQELYFDARVALDDFAALESDLTQMRQADPLRFTTALQLAQVYVLREQPGPLQQLLENYRRLVIVRYPEEGNRVADRLEARVAYALGNFDKVIQHAKSDPGPDGQLSRFQAQIESGQWENAAREITPGHPLLNEPLHLLAVRLVLEDAGQADLARQWGDQARARMKESRREYVIAAEMLEAPNPPAIESLLRLTLPPQSKAVLLVALARKHPERRAELHSLAQRLNVHLDFPYHLLRRWTTGA